MRGRTRATVLGLGLVLMLAAASAIVLQNGDDPVNSTSSSSSSEASDTVLDTTPIESSPAEPVTATAPTDSSEDAVETTATTALLSGVDADVHAATLGYYEYYWKCLRAPGGCEPSRVTVAGSDAFDDLTDVARTLLQNGLFVGDEEEGDIYIGSITVDGDRATVATCWWTTAVLYLQSPIQGDPPIAQDNPTTSGHQVYDIVRDPADDIWRVERGDQIDDLIENVNQCTTG